MQRASASAYEQDNRGHIRQQARRATSHTFWHRMAWHRLRDDPPPPSVVLCLGPCHSRIPFATIVIVKLEGTRQTPNGADIPARRVQVEIRAITFMTLLTRVPLFSELKLAVPLVNQTANVSR